MFTIKKSRESLCETCRNSIIAKDIDGRNVLNICNSGSPIQIKSIIAECTDYRFKYSDPWEFKESAWILEVKKGQVIGFRPPGKEKESA